MMSNFNQCHVMLVTEKPLNLVSQCENPNDCFFLFYHKLSKLFVMLNKAVF